MKCELTKAQYEAKFLEEFVRIYNNSIRLKNEQLDLNDVNIDTKIDYFNLDSLDSSIMTMEFEDTYGIEIDYELQEKLFDPKITLETFRNLLSEKIAFLP